MPVGDATVGVTLRGRAAYLPEPDTVVVADLHLGRGRASNVELPLGEQSAIPERLQGVLESFEPSSVVLAGDVLHSFSSLPEGAESALREVEDRIEATGATLTVVRGNHDTMLRTLLDPVAEHRLSDGKTVVVHGHEPPTEAAERYVIGHEHPAIEIEGQRRPCALLGRGVYEGADVLALPAFNRLAAGTEVNGMRSGDPSSPLLADVGSFRPVVWDPEAEETLVFPPLERFRQLL